jgi:hypothetical protein
LEAKSDACLLYGTLTTAFLALLLRHDMTRAVIGLGPWAPLSMADFTQRMPLDHAAFLLLVLVTAGLIAASAVVQCEKLRQGQPLNLPKLIFLASVIALHASIGFALYPRSTDLLGFIAIVTINHDVQYYNVIWLYARNRYRQQPNAEQRFGFAATLSKSFPLMLGLGIVTFSAPFWLMGCVTNRIPVCGPGVDWGTMTYLGQTAGPVILTLLQLGFQIHHYMLDQYIWRPSRSRQLQAHLQVATAADGAATG